MQQIGFFAPTVSMATVKPQGVSVQTNEAAQGEAQSFEKLLAVQVGSEAANGVSDKAVSDDKAFEASEKSEKEKDGEKSSLTAEQMPMLFDVALMTDIKQVVIQSVESTETSGEISLEAIGAKTQNTAAVPGEVLADRAEILQPAAENGVKLEASVFDGELKAETATLEAAEEKTVQTLDFAQKSDGKAAQTEADAIGIKGEVTVDTDVIAKAELTDEIKAEVRLEAVQSSQISDRESVQTGETADKAETNAYDGEVKTQETAARKTLDCATQETAELEKPIIALDDSDKELDFTQSGKTDTETQLKAAGISEKQLTEENSGETEAFEEQTAQTPVKPNEKTAEETDEPLKTDKAHFNKSVMPAKSTADKEGNFSLENAPITAAGSTYGKINAVSESLKPVDEIAVSAYNQITDSIKVNLDAGRKEFTMELNPVSLGKVLVKLISEGGKLTVELAAYNPKTHALLLEGSEDIRNILQTGTQQRVVVEESADAHMNNQGFAQQQPQQNGEDNQGEESKNANQDFTANDFINFMQMLKASYSA